MMNVFRMNSVRLFFVSCLLAFTLASCTEDSDYTLGVWKRRSDFDGVARSDASGFMINGNGFVCCGYTGKDRLNDLWEYNVAGDYWTQRASMPDAAGNRNSAAGFSANNKGYITTGYNGNDYLKDTWEYDPTTNTWAQKDDYTGGVRYCALSFSIGNYGYVGTGYNDNYLKDFYKFDPTAAPGSQWTIMNGFGGQKRMSGSTFVIDNIAYVVGGLNNGSYVTDFWKYDPSTDKWTQLRDIADTNDDEDYDDDYAGIKRANAVTFVIDGKAYLVTGESGSLLSDYWVYDPTTDLWSGDSDDDYTPFTTDASARINAVGFSTGTRGFVVTGRSSSYRFDDMWELSPYENEEN